MKILTLADVESKALWEHLDRDYLNSADLILSAGDLKPDYLEYLEKLCKEHIEEFDCIRKGQGIFDDGNAWMKA